MKSINPNRGDLPFGGITVVLGGDFRQILHVVTRGSRSDIVNACITRSRLWHGCQIFKLKINMRLTTGSTASEDNIIKHFGNWILEVGNDGSRNLYLQNNQHSLENEVIAIPEEHCLSLNKWSTHDIIETTFPDLVSRYEDIQYLSERVILTPTNLTVAHLNAKVLEIIPGESFRYYSFDKGEEFGCSDHDVRSSFPTEYLNSLTIHGIPPHELVLKVGALVMLMRNLNQTIGLCNGTRMIVRRCLKNSVECEVIAGNFVGTRHFIPRMELIPTECRLPFNLIRRQFPLQICYTMTINKSQGQSLQSVDLYLPKPVFTHGQLYVALSQVTSPQGLKFFIETDTGKTTNITRNLVYDEVFYNVSSLK